MSVEELLDYATEEAKCVIQVTKFQAGGDHYDPETVLKACAMLVNIANLKTDINARAYAMGIVRGVTDDDGK